MNPEEIRSQMSALQRKYDEVLKKTHLNDTRDEIARLDKGIHALDDRLQRIRQQGYAFNSLLEERIAEITPRWKKAKDSLEREVIRQVSRLNAKVDRIKPRMNALRKHPSPPLHQIRGVQADIDALLQEIETSEKSISSQFQAIMDEYRALNTRLQKIEWMLEQLNTAQFTLLETESGVRACKAVWAKDGASEEKGDPEGILYLTDQRILFERKEKVATRKVLFITTEKKLVHELLFESPAALIESATAEHQGLFNKDDYLMLSFEHGAPHHQMAFHIWDAGEDWVEAIRAVQQDSLDRVLEIEAEAVEKIKNAPSQCPSCGAALSQVILRGQDTLTCEYCGYVIRL